MAAAKAYVAGFDIGGTRIKTAAVAKNGKVLWQHTMATGAEKGPDHLVQSIVEQVRLCEQRLQAQPLAVALGISGAVDPKRGVVLLPGKFKELEGYPLVSHLRRRLRVPVIAENDGRISILAEKYYGAARNRKWVVCLTLGTGVGSGVMLDGLILRDPHLQFGTQLGHMVLQASGGKLCLTGARGTAETLCSANALAIAVRDGLQRGIPSVLSEAYLQNPHSIDFAAVIRGVEQDDALCVDALRVWTENVGWLLVSAVHAFAPEVVILSGGAVQAAAHFLPALREQLKRHVYRYPKNEEVPLIVSTMGDMAGAMGAAGLAWEHAQT